MPIEFVAAGSPRDLSRAIEEFAHGQGSVTAIVVPWESSATRLTMSVTSVRADGWAIEHTNLGTITLTDVGGDATGVSITPSAPDHAEGRQLSALFERFARELRDRFAST